MLCSNATTSPRRSRIWHFVEQGFGLFAPRITILLEQLHTPSLGLRHRLRRFGFRVGYLHWSGEQSDQEFFRTAYRRKIGARNSACERIQRFPESFRTVALVDSLGLDLWHAQLDRAAKLAHIDRRRQGTQRQTLLLFSLHPELQVAHGPPYPMFHRINLQVTDEIDLSHGLGDAITLEVLPLQVGVVRPVGRPRKHRSPPGPVVARSESTRVIGVSAAYLVQRQASMCLQLRNDTQGNSRIPLRIEDRLLELWRIAPLSRTSPPLPGSSSACAIMPDTPQFVPSAFVGDCHSTRVLTIARK